MKRVREIVVSNVEIEDKFSWWFNTNDSQLYYFTLGKWSTLFGKASPSQDGLMSKEDKEVLNSLSMGSSVVTVPTYADLEAYAVKSEVILYVVKATNKIYRFSNNTPIEINTFYFNSLEEVKNLQGVGVYYVIVENETYILYISQVGSQLTYILHSPKKYIECSYNTSNSEWSEWVTTNYDAAGAILDIQNWVNAQVAQQNATLSSMQEQLTTMNNSMTSNFNIFNSSLNSLSLDVTNVKNNIATINAKISQINNTITALTQANNTLNNRVLNLENNYASKTWANGRFATINNLNIASNQINTNSLIIQGLIPRVETLEGAVAALQSISSSYMLKSEADNTYATISALSSLEEQVLNNSDQINLHSILIANLQNNNVTQTDLDTINTQIAGLVSNINSLYEISATKTALNTTNNNLASLETRVDVLEDNKADKATTLQGYGITDAYTKAEVDAKVSSVYTYKGTIADYNTLLTLTNMQVGDVYNLISTGENFSWTGSAWESLAGTIDLSAYLEKTEAATIYETKSNVAALQVTINANTSAIVDLQNSQLEIEEAVSDLTIASESFLTKVDAATLYTTKTLFNTTADQVILNTSAISSLQTLKADKSSTLSGYGITDAYTKSQIDTLFVNFEELDPVFTAWKVLHDSHLSILFNPPTIDQDLKFLNAAYQWATINVGSSGYQAPLYFTSVESSIDPLYKNISYLREVDSSELFIELNNNTAVLAQFLYSAQIGVDSIDSGNWGFYARVKMNNTVGDTYIYAVPILYHINNTVTPLAPIYLDKLTNIDYKDIYKQFPAGTIACSPTDILGCIIYATSTAVNKTVYLETGDGHPSYLSTPLRFRHNQLRDLDGDTNFQHFTLEQKEFVLEAAGLVSTHTGQIQDLITGKQDLLTAGDNIVISDNVISVDLSDYLKTEDASNTYETIANVQTLSDIVSGHTGDIESLEENKADKATTLSGYGITDAYTKTEVDDKLDNIEHDNTLNKDGNPLFLHATQAQHDRWTNNYSYKIEDTRVSAWAASTAYAGYGYQAQINIPNLTENDIVNVTFSGVDVISGNYYPTIQFYEGYILVFSKVNTTITIPTIEITKIDL